MGTYTSFFRVLATKWEKVTHKCKFEKLNFDSRAVKRAECSDAPMKQTPPWLACFPTRLTWRETSWQTPTPYIHLSTKKKYYNSLYSPFNSVSEGSKHECVTQHNQLLNKCWFPLSSAVSPASAPSEINGLYQRRHQPAARAEKV